MSLKRYYSKIPPGCREACKDFFLPASQYVLRTIVRRESVHPCLRDFRRAGRSCTWIFEFGFLICGHTDSWPLIGAKCHTRHFDGTSLSTIMEWHIFYASRAREQPFYGHKIFRMRDYSMIPSTKTNSVFRIPRLVKIPSTFAGVHSPVLVPSRKETKNGKSSMPNFSCKNTVLPTFANCSGKLFTRLCAIIERNHEWKNRRCPTENPKGAKNKRMCRCRVPGRATTRRSAVRNSEDGR